MFFYGANFHSWFQCLIVSFISRSNVALARVNHRTYKDFPEVIICIAPLINIQAGAKLDF
jgi:hypothetical protein